MLSLPPTVRVFVAVEPFDKEHQRRRVVRRYTCRCRACGERTTLRSLPAPYERSKVTCEWLAWLVYQKFWLLTPLDRIRRDLGERGIPLAMSTLVSFIERAADLLSGVDGLHWKQLLASSWMATDGTGLKVIVPQLPAAHNGYIELYRNDELAVFQYEPDKSGDVVAASSVRFAALSPPTPSIASTSFSLQIACSKPDATPTVAASSATPRPPSPCSPQKAARSSVPCTAKSRRHKS